MYNFLFDNKHHVNIFVTLFAKITNYISIENEYTYIKDIGKGSFCQMKLARHNSTGLLYAIKKIKKDVGSPEEFTTLNWEKDIVHFLKHLPCTKHILKCYNTIETLDHLYILTEYIAGGSLSSFIRKNNVCLPSSTVKEIIMQVTSGVAVLHSYGIVHRDLKLENILMDYLDMQTFTAKIIDFGLSQVITPLSKTKETYGTLIYCSPEILLNVPYNYKVDVWSLGVISYYLEYTFMPFGIRGKEAEQEISNKIIMSELKFPRKVDSRNDQNEIKANKQITMVIKRCLTRDINQRLTTAQMLSYLMDSGSK
jgi:MAP/microtubule affinity-regulating kinase